MILDAVTNNVNLDSLKKFINKYKEIAKEGGLDTKSTTGTEGDPKVRGFKTDDEKL